MSMDDHHGIDNRLLSIFLKQHFHNHKPSNVVSTTVTPAVPEGENFTSCVRRVKFRCLLASGKERTFSMIVKTEHPSEKLKEVFSCFPIFMTEIKAYTSILPIMEDLMNEFDDPREKLWPNMYGFEPYRMVCFEDLTAKHYIGARRRTRMDLIHSKLVLRTIARFHAMSMVLISRGVITEENKGKFNIVNDTMKNVWHIIFTVLCNSMVHDWGDEWKDISEKLLKIKDDVPLVLNKLTNDYDKRFEVLNHGDLWTSNLLFRYMEFEGIPTTVRIVDYQILHLNSFIWDVEQFLTTSADSIVRRENRDLLLETYHESLEKNLKFFNYAGYIPTVDDVKAESRRIEYARMCWIACQPIIMAESTNGFDREKLNTHPPEEVIDKSVYSDGKALIAIGEDLRMYAASGLI